MTPMAISAAVSNCLDILGSVFPSGNATQSSRAASGADSTESFSGSMTTAQIRGAVDKMAINGQLSGQQQVALVAAGLQDLDASNPSYQPAEQTGYTRASTGTVDVVNLMNDYAAFDAAHGNTSLASTYSSLAKLFQSESTSGVSLLA